jgi:hypothetical protein
LQKTATSYQIRSGLLNDAGAWTDTSWYDISNNWTAVEIHYQAFMSTGSLTLWLDDIQNQSFTFIDNDTRTLTDASTGSAHASAWAQLLTEAWCHIATQVPCRLYVRRSSCSVSTASPWM